MADLEAGRTAIQKRDGLALYQTFAGEEFEVPTVVIRIESDRSGPVMVAIDGRLPAAVGANHVGFHPGYRADDWTIEGEVLTFRTELEADETVTTLYAIPGLSAGTAEQLLEAVGFARIEEVTGHQGAAGPPSADGAPGEAAAWSDQSTEDGSGHPAPGEPEPVGPSSAAEPGSTSPSRSETTDDVDTETNGSTPPRGGSDGSTAHDEEVAAAEEPVTDAAGPPRPSSERSSPEDGTARTGPQDRSGPVGGPEHEPERRNEEAADPAGVGPEPGRDAGSEHSQPDPGAGDGRSERFDRSSLESAPTEQLLAEVERRLGEDERLAAVLGDGATTEARPTDHAHARLEKRMRAIEERLAAVESADDAVQSLRETFDDQAETLASVEADTASLVDRLDAVIDRLEDQEEATATLQGRMDALETELAGTNEEVSALSEELVEYGADQADIQRRVSELVDWRDGFMDTLEKLKED